MTTATTTMPASGTTPGPTALQRHAAFFDPQGTGLVTIGQTFVGMRRLGVHLVWRVLLAPIINGFLGYLTQGRPSLVIRIDRIAKGKHPFDSGTFDTGGEVDSSAFDALFQQYGDAISLDEMRAVISARGNRLPQMGKLAGVLGHFFSDREVGVFFCVASDTTKVSDGRVVDAVTRDTLRRFYEGTLFPDLARRRLLVEGGCVCVKRNSRS
ncbi:MAG: caleosin family protein [Polyangiaceae bacterium]